ncbi:hypothetical protein FHS95_003135 [Sphingomonas naasensis]|uniref:Uncharacterized protein n=1 Tax=Sphingomonas naasensis TaxID=1344951 RepID=A0A4S1WEZ0_9SPHN|nr:hypothetical protein [Sphingomonas naasensis]NIJ21432.1 hypothetical protein [Sphingomonas naasensis]TGX41608.1 hypothetical protein E5A74_13430 [Sphingomonas naasensis]
MRVNVTALLLSLGIVAGIVAALASSIQILPFLGTIVGREAGLRQAAPPASCREVRRDSDGRYAFSGDCGGQAPAPDGAFLVVKNPGEGTGVGVVRAGTGAAIGDLGVLDDGMGFTVLWSARPRWFVADHYLGSGLAEAHLFEIVDGALVPRPRLIEEARRVLRAHGPCLPAGQLVVASVRWSRDGTRLVLVAGARPDACGTNGEWDWLWMIGDPATGRVDPASVRVIRDPPPKALPQDGPYASL